MEQLEFTCVEKDSSDAWTELSAQLTKQLNGGGIEQHVTAYPVRELLPEELQSVHENLVFACDENGLYKGYVFNKRAGFITGLMAVGDCYFYLGQDINYDEDTGEETYGEHRDMTLTTMERLWNATKDLEMLKNAFK